MRICVIGAGVAGLSSGRHGLAAGYDVTLFEQTKSVGGSWVYTDQVGNDEFGMPVHSCMYKGLRTNLPKEIMGYPDYPFPDEPASYLPSASVLKYLEAFADDFHVREHIRFQHEVVRVRPLSGSWESRQWEVIVRDIIPNRYDKLIFDAVVVSSGHHTVPKIPDFIGFHEYQGSYLHSKDYRTPDRYAGKRVLVVGLGPSGVDIAMMTATVADHVVVSYHNPNGTQKLPANIERKPNIRRFTESEVEFVDGSIMSFDEILFCTGYNYTFPFLSVDSGITVEDGSFVKPLFKHCINIEHPTMLIPGLVFRTCPFQVIDVQVRFFYSFLGGHRPLPSRSEMLAITENDVEISFKEANGNKRLMHQLDKLQANYYNDLSTIGDVKNVKPYILKIYKAAITYRKADTTNYRNQTFQLIDDENFTSGFLDNSRTPSD